MLTAADWSPRNGSRFLRCAIEIDAYWQVLDASVGWSPQERNRLRFSFFYNELVPRRTAMLQIADRIASVNERGLTRSEERSAASADSLRRYLMWTFAGTLGGGLILALLTIGFTLRLERELDLRRADLQELSTLLLRAQENERRALARELHDEIGQSLSAILMETEGAECADAAGRHPRTSRFDQGAGGEDGEPGARSGAAAAALDAGRSRPGAGAELACA